MFFFIKKGRGLKLLSLDRFKFYIPFVIVAFIVCLLFFFTEDKEKEELPMDLEHEPSISTLEVDNEEKSEEKDAVEIAIVDLKGEVKRPGVYQVEIDERVEKVIELAGGFTDQADLRQINLAQKVQDEMVIYVPAMDEDMDSLTAGASLTSSAGREAQSRENGDGIRVNVATEEELTNLQGIGPAKAQAIIQYREENGPFQELEDLLEVNGIGEKTLENMQDQVILP